MREVCEISNIIYERIFSYSMPSSIINVTENVRLKKSEKFDPDSRITSAFDHRGGFIREEVE